MIVSRDIKFRAWDKAPHTIYDTDPAISRMCYFGPDYYLDDDGFLRIESPQGLGPIGDHDQTRFSPLMQYTGLLDKNGKEIYEGDIVLAKKLNGEEYTAEVKFHHGGFRVFKQNRDGKFRQWMNIGARNGDLEVIGNIYQDKELLR